MMIWIFVGVVVATTMFLMVMYQHNRDELRTQFLTVNALNNEDIPLKPKVIDTQDSLDEKLWNLAQQLSEKEKLAASSAAKISAVEQRIARVAAENPTNEAEDRTNKKVLEELKMELALTELECKNLQEQIRVISARREELKNEVVKQQQLFSLAMNNLVTDFRFVRDDKQADGGKTVGSAECSPETNRPPMFFGRPGQDSTSLRNLSD